MRATVSGNCALPLLPTSLPQGLCESPDGVRFDPVAAQSYIYPSQARVPPTRTHAHPPQPHFLPTPPLS